MEKNIDYVAGIEEDSRWQIRRLISYNKRNREARQLYEEDIRTFYRVIQSFFRPTKVTLTLLHVPADRYLNRLDYDKTRFTREIEDSEGVTAEDILSVIDEEAPNAPSQTITPVGVFLEGECYLYIDGDFRYLSKEDTEYYKCWNSTEGITDSDPRVDPVYIRCSTSPLGKLGSEFVPNIYFNSDIWFEESQVGDLNRAQVLALLARIVGVFDLNGINTPGERWRSLLETMLDHGQIGKEVTW